MNILHFIFSVITGANGHWNIINNKFTSAFLAKFPGEEDICAATSSEAIISQCSTMFSRQLMWDLVGPGNGFAIVRNPVRLWKLEPKHVSSTHCMLVSSFLRVMPEWVAIKEMEAIGHVKSHLGQVSSARYFELTIDMTNSEAIKKVAFSAGDQFRELMAPLKIDIHDPVYTCSFSLLWLRYAKLYHEMLIDLLSQRDEIRKSC